MRATMVLCTDQSCHTEFVSAWLSDIRPYGADQAVLCETWVTTANPPHPAFLTPAKLTRNPRPAVACGCPPRGSEVACCERSCVNLYTPERPSRPDRSDHDLLATTRGSLGQVSPA